MTSTAIFKGKIFLQVPAQRLLLLLAVPMIGIVLLMAVFRNTLPHWTGPAYITLIPLVAAWLTSLQLTAKIPVQAKWALGFTTVLLIPAIVIINWLPYNWGSKE